VLEEDTGRNKKPKYSRTHIVPDRNVISHCATVPSDPESRPPTWHTGFLRTQTECVLSAPGSPCTNATRQIRLPIIEARCEPPTSSNPSSCKAANPSENPRMIVYTVYDISQHATGVSLMTYTECFAALVVPRCFEESALSMSGVQINFAYHRTLSNRVSESPAVCARCARALQRNVPKVAPLLQDKMKILRASRNSTLHVP
jgi:hypothetical protein